MFGISLNNIIFMCVGFFLGCFVSNKNFRLKVYAMIDGLRGKKKQPQNQQTQPPKRYADEEEYENLPPRNNYYRHPPPPRDKDTHDY